MRARIYKTAKVVTQSPTIGNGCLIGDCAFVAARRLVMKKGSQIGPHAILGGGGDITLGEFSVVGFGAMLFPATDTTGARFMCEAAPPEGRDIVRGSIVLEGGAYIGAGAVVCVSKKQPNICIGKHSVIGSLCYIDRSIPDDIIIHPRIEYITKRRDA